MKLTPYTFHTISLLVGVCLGFVRTEEDLLMWEADPKVVDQKRFYLESDSGDDIIIDGAMYPATVKIANRMSRSTPSIVFKCHVKRLRDDKRITNAKFCKDDDCVDISPSFKLAGNIQFTATIDYLTGAEISTNWGTAFHSSQRPDYAGFYWCDFGNIHGNLRSSVLTIQDVMRPFRDLNQYQNSRVIVFPRTAITTAELPLTLQCPGATLSGTLTRDLQHNIRPLLEWKLCAVSADMTAQLCHRQLSSSATTLDVVFPETIVHADGNLTIFTLNTLTTFDRYALICYDPRDLAKFYGLYAGEKSTDNELFPLYIDGTEPFRGSPSVRGPQVDTIRLREGERSVDYKLIALYHADYSKVRVTWLKDGIVLPGQSEVTGSRYFYSLGKNIDRDVAGTYTLKVSYETIVDYFKFTFHVLVESAPLVLGTHSPRTFIMEQQVFDITVHFYNADSVCFFINGVNLTYTSLEEMNSMWSHRAQHVKLASLKFTVTPYPLMYLLRNSPQKNATVVYTTQPLKMEASHVVTFEGRNAHGLIRLNKLVRVVSLPVFRTSPKSQSCTSNCDLSSRRLFSCALETHIRQSIHESGAILRTTWQVNDVEVPEGDKKPPQEQLYMNLFKLHNGSETLEVVPLGRLSEAVREDVRVRLKEMVQIKCKVEIFDPAHFPPSAVSTPRLYDSCIDARLEVRDDLMAQLSLTGAVIETANVSWVWPTILAILILFIVAILITYLCIRNREGATYLVDEQERAQGKDPEKEIIEKEAFHTYDRNDTDRGGVAGSRISMDNSVGFQSDSDADDLEMYDLDPGKFNEDGSFIYKYGQNQQHHQPQMHGYQVGQRPVGQPLPPPPPPSQPSNSVRRLQNGGFDHRA